MDKPRFEWPTLALLITCYALWAVGLTWAWSLWAPLGFVLTVVMIALHSSLTHEMVHGHPFRDERLNEGIMAPCLGLFVPFRRFRDLHLAHHVDSRLTDPYDDPESNYFDPAVWVTLPRWAQMGLRMHNTLAGRMLLGPGLGIKIRTFLEHRAHERASGRTVVIEDRGFFAFLFLNNNYHVVHHMHPRVPWYDLPAMFRANRDKYLRRNDGYYYRSYREIFAQHFLRAKDPVPHPLMEHEHNREKIAAE